MQKAFLSMQEPFLSIQKARQHMFNIRIPIRTIERITFSFFTALFIAVPLLTHSHNILPGYGHMSWISCALVQLLRTCHELIYTSCLPDFPISASKSLAVPRYGYVFFLDLGKSFRTICIVNFVTVPNLLS